jgi:hypothetical protein
LLGEKGDGILFGIDLAGNTKTLDQREAEDENHDALRLPQVPVTDVPSVFSRMTEVTDEYSILKHADGAAIESVGSKPEEVDLSRARGTEMVEDLSDVSSVRSMDSIFSSLTVSSMSSVGARPGPGESFISC